MIADYLRPYAQWRINRPDSHTDDRNARAAIGLIDAATYVTQLRDTAPVIVRMAFAGCFSMGWFEPGPEGEGILRGWHYADASGTASDLLEAVAAAAERWLAASVAASAGEAASVTAPGGEVASA